MSHGTTPERRIALEACLQALDEARRTGAPSLVLSFRAAPIREQYLSGDWDEALREAGSRAESPLEEVEDRCLPSSRCRFPGAILLVARGESAGAEEVVDWRSEEARSTDMLVGTRLRPGRRDRRNLELGRPEAVRESLEPAGRRRRIIDYMEFVTVVVRAAIGRSGCSHLAA